MAITLVMFSHTWATTNPVSLPWHLTNNGDLGVRIFFVISGFLITYLLIEEHRKTGSISLRNFYIRRALRIFPVYYLYLAVLAALTSWNLYTDATTSWIGALTYTRNMLGQGRSATSHLWSLAVEEQFYVVWPVILVALGLCSRWRLAISLLVSIALTAFAMRLLPCDSDTFVCARMLNPKSALRYADSLAVGCVGSFLFANTPLAIPRSIRVSALYGIFAILCASTMWQPSSSFAVSALITAQATATMSLIILSISETGTMLFRLLNSRPAIFIGVISYSLYVWHVLFLSHYMGIEAQGILHDGRTWWIASLAVASSSYFLIERPILRLKGRLTAPHSPAVALSH